MGEILNKWLSALLLSALQWKTNHAEPIMRRDKNPDTGGDGERKGGEGGEEDFAVPCLEPQH